METILCQELQNKALDKSLCFHKFQHPHYKMGRLGESSAATLLALEVYDQDFL